MNFTASRAGITLPTMPGDTRYVDVHFDDDRVWSLDLNVDSASLSGRYSWPAALVPYLIGSTTVVLHDSRNGESLARTQVVFTDDPIPTRVVDDEGVPLMVNKWGRLGKSLEAGNPGVQERILERSSTLIHQLAEMGLRPFVSCGTLLGAVRAGALLPHDDDADLGYLSQFTNPVDVAREGFEVGHRLESLGYELVRHSATHMQVIFRGDRGQLDHYIDVFATFFSEDGYINQPFPVRGPMREDQMLPFSTVSIQGRDYPAPADPEHWLLINYDEDWRIPNPGYRIVTPRSTARRFDNWFGLFHYNRDFWDELYADHPGGPRMAWKTGSSWILGQSESLASRWLIDLGCGAGDLGVALQMLSHERQVVAADYSESALGKTWSSAEGTGLMTAHVNLHRTTSLTLPAQLGIDGPFDLVANHVLEQCGPDALQNVLRLMRMALRSGGAALATFYGAADLGADPIDPTSWGISPERLRVEAARYGLHVEFERLRSTWRERRRKPYGARFILGDAFKEDE